MFSKLLRNGNHPLIIITDRELALMKAIHALFPMTPNLLCIWRIEKNVFAHYKGHKREINQTLQSVNLHILRWWRRWLKNVVLAVIVVIIEALVR